MEWLNALDTYMTEWGRSLGYASESFVRLLLALACGGIIGMEREVRGREAGFRTHALVCLGCALAMVVSIHFAYEPWHPPPLQDGVTLTIDPSRVAYSIMSGVGFLGAGAILKHGASIQGLTTAAGLWCVAAIGLAAGFGQYGVALLATFLVLFTLWVLDYFGSLLPHRNRYEIVVRRRWEPGCVNATVDRVAATGVSVFDALVDRTPDLRFADVRLSITCTGKLFRTDLERQLDADDTYQLMAMREG